MQFISGNSYLIFAVVLGSLGVSSCSDSLNDVDSQSQHDANSKNSEYVSDANSKNGSASNLHTRELRYESTKEEDIDFEDSAAEASGEIQTRQADDLTLNLDLHQSVLKSLNHLTERQGSGLEEANIDELENLSEADRQSLQMREAERTMNAANLKAIEQIEKAERDRLGTTQE